MSVFSQIFFFFNCGLKWELKRFSLQFWVVFSYNYYKKTYKKLGRLSEVGTRSVPLVIRRLPPSIRIVPLFCA